jgi:hypothetical protein
MDDTATMVPARRRSMPRRAVRERKNAPVRFTRIASFQSSALIRIVRASRLAPAFSTSASSGPSPASAASTIAVASASSPTSAWWTSARRPSASTASAVARAPASSRR